MSHLLALHLSLIFAATPSRPVHSDPPVVEIVATDFAFTAPDTLAPGFVTFRFINRGPSIHHAHLVALPEGKNLADLLAGMRGNVLPSWAIPVGGAGSEHPGGSGETSLELTPGHYAFICIVPDTAGVPHFHNGMVRGLVVTGAARGARPPAADVEVTLTDYAFQLSRPLHAGRQVIAVRNAGQQQHELLFIKLMPGKHLSDYLAWRKSGEGPAPGFAVGGTAPFAPGRSNVAALTLERGTYVLSCFAPDAQDGRPHVMHGMSREITIE